MHNFLLFLLPIAAATGWYAGFRQTSSETNVSRRLAKKIPTISQEYLKGLNYLINEQPDKAIEVFIRMLDVNNDTVETHLALGNLFRRRGEVDRAIRIHQNLIARPQLNANQRAQSLSELGQDYLRAGLLDRAENLFLELIKIKAEVPSSYKYLLNIYQLQKDWEKAIAIAKKLLPINKMKMQIAIAHYYCELAELAIAQNNIIDARVYLKKAHSSDKYSVRTKMIYAKLAFAIAQYETTITHCKNIEQQAADYFGEVLPLLIECYTKLNKEPDLIDYLKGCLKKRPQMAVMLALTEQLKKIYGIEAAVTFLIEEMSNYNSLRGIGCLLDFSTQTALDNNTKNNLTYLRQFLNKLLEVTPNYRCTHCGFAGKYFYWHCPGCRQWNTVKPALIETTEN